MKIKLALFLAFVFVCGCSCAFANSTYTDSFDTQNIHCCNFTPWGPPPLGFTQYDVSEIGLGGQRFATYNPSNILQVYMQVDFSALVSTFHEVVDCWGSQCNYTWDGTFSSGSAQIDSTVIVAPSDIVSLTFTGTVTGGTFTGYLLNYCGGPPNVWTGLRVSGRHHQRECRWYLEQRLEVPRHHEHV